MSRYDLFRRRLAPIAFVLAMGLVIRESCQKQQRTHATIHVGLPAQKTLITSVDADVVVDGDNVGHLHRTTTDLPIDARPLQFAVSLPNDDGELDLELDLVNGTHKRIVRRFHASEGATVDVRLTDDDLR